MADTDVGKRADYHSEFGDLIVWITDYEAGRDNGDHHVVGFNNAKSKESQGDLFSAWTVVGSEQGAITVR